MKNVSILDKISSFYCVFEEKLKKVIALLKNKE